MKERKLKILLVSPYNAKRVGGIGTWSKSILDYYGKVSNKYQIIFQNTSNPLKSNIKKGIVWRILIGIEDSFVILFKLFWNILVKQPDVVHYTSSASLALSKDKIALFITKYIFKKKFVIHWHFGRIPEICNEKGNEYKKLIDVIRKSDVNIVLDIKSLKSLEKEKIHNVVNIPNPMTSAIYETTKNIFIEKINEKRAEGEVLFVGHILKTKGVFELVSACIELPSVKKLIMIGPFLPEIKNELIKLVDKYHKNNILEFKGELPREAVYDYYKKCSIFCLPSYSEGFPYVILEAMAFGCPIVATKVGAIEEMLQNESGILVSPRNIMELKKEIENLISDKNKRNLLSEKAYKRVMSVYTNETIFKQYEKEWN